VNELKKLVNVLMQGGSAHSVSAAVAPHFPDIAHAPLQPTVTIRHEPPPAVVEANELRDESLLLNDKELELMKKALERHRGKRKLAALELGISERTLYRKIKEYNLE